MSTESPVLDWLRAMNVAMSARHLYRPDHPRVVDAVATLSQVTERLIGGAASTALFMSEGRLAVDGQLVPDAGPTALKVFQPLMAAGFDRLSLLRGVTPEELEALVSSLAGSAREHGGTPHQGPRSSAHVRLSVIDLAGDDSPVVEAAPMAVAIDPRRLPAVWRGIEDAHVLDGDMLDSLLAPIVEVVGAEGGEILPLSSLQSHDDYTATHITNVAVLTMALAEATGMPSSAVRQVGVAALLHDIGKMKIPAGILSKKGRLTPEELALMRQHPQIGARMLMGTPGIPPLAAIVAFEHHLQADGGGYPDVPHGWKINPASAMTHIADVYDALRTHRPYRAALEHAKIGDLMMRDRGTVFPAELLDIFFERVVPRAFVPPAPPPAD